MRVDKYSSPSKIVELGKRVEDKIWVTNFRNIGGTLAISWPEIG